MMCEKKWATQATVYITQCMVPTVDTCYHCLSMCRNTIQSIETVSAFYSLWNHKYIVDAYNWDYFL